VELPRHGDDVIGADPTHLADGDKLKMQHGPLPQVRAGKSAVPNLNYWV
jgi:hypothetical protein